MKRTIALLGLATASLTLTSCATDGYGYGGLGWSSYPYSGWYDGYYGPLYDGYWGTDNYFYYRLNPTDRAYRRGDHEHFRQQQTQPSEHFHRFEGTIQPPQRGTRAPSLPRGDGGGHRRHP